VGKTACQHTLAFFRSSIEGKYKALVDPASSDEEGCVALLWCGPCLTLCARSD
jgi:hypothetical protein